MNRRTALKSMTAAGVGAALSALSKVAFADEASAEEKTESKPKYVNPIVVSSYSYWVSEDAPTMEQCIDWASEMGFEGLEILEKQMYLNPKAGKITSSVIPGGGQMFQTYETNPEYLCNLKKYAFENGVSLCGYATHQSFLDPREDFREKNIKTTIAGIESAYALGIPVLRVNTGRWGTSKSFMDLMNHKGIEPALEGYKDEDGFPWVIDSLEKCLPVAEKCGVILGLENHWGLARRAEGALKIVNEIDSPWMKIILDTGNLLDDDRYEQMEALATKACFVHAKFYYGGGIYYTLDMDYNRIAQILRKANFKGYISVEFEGKENAMTALPKCRQTLLDAFNA